MNYLLKFLRIFKSLKEEQNTKRGGKVSKEIKVVQEKKQQIEKEIVEKDKQKKRQIEN